MAKVATSPRLATNLTAQVRNIADVTTADVAEERFTRTKHYAGLPIHAIEYCLKSQQLTMADLDAVAVPVDDGARVWM